MQQILSQNFYAKMAQYTAKEKLTKQWKMCMLASIKLTHLLIFSYKDTALLPTIYKYPMVKWKLVAKQL